MEHNQEIILKELERDGLKRMRQLNKEFLAKNEGSDEVRHFLAKAGTDNALMLAYLKGRKYRPEHAWKTLKRKAEVRFDEYPDVFTNEIPRCLVHFQDIRSFGVLKNRDQHGRRVLCCYGRKWDPEVHPMDEIIKAGVYIFEFLIKDEDALNNGIVFIQTCEGMGMNHAKQYTLYAMLGILNIFWYANPLKVKGVFYANVPFYLTFVFGIIKPFLSKKLKERVFITTTSKGFSAVHSNMSPEILPKFLGGELDESEAFEILT